MNKHTITSEQTSALVAYAKWAGPDWKRRLSKDWMRAGSEWPGEWAHLQGLRNDPGFNLSQWEDLRNG